MFRRFFGHGRPGLSRKRHGRANRPGFGALGRAEVRKPSGRRPRKVRPRQAPLQHPSPIKGALSYAAPLPTSAVPGPTPWTTNLPGPGGRRCAQPRAAAPPGPQLGTSSPCAGRNIARRSGNNPKWTPQPHSARLNRLSSHSKDMLLRTQSQGPTQRKRFSLPYNINTAPFNGHLSEQLLPSCIGTYARKPRVYTCSYIDVYKIR